MKKNLTKRTKSAEPKVARLKSTQVKSVKSRNMQTKNPRSKSDQLKTAKPSLGTSPSLHKSRPARRMNSQQASPRDFLEGRRALKEALDLNIALEEVYFLIQHEDGGLEQLKEELRARGVPIRHLARVALDKLSSHGAHQGVIAKLAPFAYASLSELVTKARGDFTQNQAALVVVLDHITDEGNFGAIVRSAEVVGASGVVIPKVRSASVGIGAYKTSAGAVLHLPIAQVSNIATTLKLLKDEGFWIGAASEHAQQTVWDAPVEGKFALVMGSEGRGLSPLVQKTCDFMCKLPQVGRIESLNVAQAATVICYEWLHRNMRSRRVVSDALTTTPSTSKPISGSCEAPQASTPYKNPPTQHFSGGLPTPEVTHESMPKSTHGTPGL